MLRVQSFADASSSNSITTSNWWKKFYKIIGHCYKTFFLHTLLRIGNLNKNPLSQSPKLRQNFFKNFYTSGLYYKHIMIANYDYSTINKFGASLSDDARVVIYDHHMFIEQPTGANAIRLFTAVSNEYS
jgi:hypothetical protein